MRIRTALLTSLVVSMLMVTGLAVASWYITVKLTKASHTQARAQEAAQQVSNLLVLTHEYVLYSEARAEQQWRAQQIGIISNLEAGVNDVVAAPSEALDEVKRLSGLFEELVAVGSQSSELKNRQKNLLISQLQSGSQGLADSVHRWGAAAVSSRERIERAYRILAVTIPVLMFAILFFITFLLNRRVLNPLLKLQQAVQATAKRHGPSRSRSSSRTPSGGSICSGFPVICKRPFT